MLVMSGLRLKDFLKLVRKELEAYNEEVKDRPAIAFLEEVTVSVQLSSISSVEGGLNIVIAELGGGKTLEKSHTITLKFTVPKLEESPDAIQRSFLMQQKRIYMGKAEKRKTRKRRKKKKAG